MSTTLSLYERETIINFNEAESIAGIYTHNIALSNKLLKLSRTEPDLRIIRRSNDMLEVEVPKKWIRVSPPKKLSEESRQKMAERLHAINNAPAEKTKKEKKPHELYKV